MNHSIAAPRLGRWRITPAIAIAALLTCAASANATTFPASTDAQFRAAIVSANGNPGPDKLAINGRILLTAQPAIITDDLVIAGNHARQATPSLFDAVDGTSVDPLAVDTLRVAASVRVSMESFTLIGAGGPGSFCIYNEGTIRVDNVMFVGNDCSRNVYNAADGSMTMTNSTMSDNTGIAVISDGGTLKILSSTIVDNGNGGIDAFGTFELRNTIVDNPGGNCFATPTGGANLTPDGTCPGITGFHELGPVDSELTSGGSTFVRNPGPGSPAIDAGDNANCPTTDQRFFVRPVGQCDIGAVEVGAVRDTTPASCAVTAVRRPPTVGASQQDVTVTDGGAGMGPDWMSNVVITNGSVAMPAAFTPFPTMRGGQVVTATKAVEGTSTRWSFDATDWAGNVKDCR